MNALVLHALVFSIFPELQRFPPINSMCDTRHQKYFLDSLSTYSVRVEWIHGRIVGIFFQHTLADSFMYFSAQQLYSSLIPILFIFRAYLYGRNVTWFGWLHELLGTQGHLYHRIEINQKSDSLSVPLKLMSSRMSPRASHRRHQYAILTSSPGSFYRRIFSYRKIQDLISTKRQQNVRLRNLQMSLNGQKCRGNQPGWLFWTCVLTSLTVIFKYGVCFA